MIIRKKLRNIYLNIIGKLCTPSPYIHILNGHMIHFEHDNIKDGEYFAQLLSELNKTCEFINIEEAVNKAYSLTNKGDVVTLSPACASFDAFPNFMARGKYFKELVMDLDD